jgi:CheY-like chemotaxis protein
MDSISDLTRRSQASGAHSPASARTGLEKKIRILFMDDEEHVRYIARGMLEFCNHEVVTVREGAAAVDTYQRAARDGRPFDIVILDLKVANGLGGLETLKLLRQIDSSVRTIVCSGTLVEPAAYYRQLGFSGILAKPFRLQDIHWVVSLVLENHPAVSWAELNAPRAPGP